MYRSTLLRASLATVALMLLPAVPATWYAAGSAEPDTMFDLPDFMFQDPPTTTKQVYFNAFPTLGATRTNPNVGLVGTHLAAYPNEHWEALFGVWVDCNRDGAIGLAETAMLEYPSEALNNVVGYDENCAVSTSDDFAHNNGTTVRELIPIGRAAECDANPQVCGKPRRYVYWHSDVRIWGDAGRPGEVDVACSHVPLPRGTTRSTGSVIAFADCFTDRRVARGVNSLSDAADPENTLGMRFEDPQNPHKSDSILNKEFPVILFGDAARTGLLDKNTDRPVVQYDPCRSGHAHDTGEYSYSVDAGRDVAPSLYVNVGDNRASHHVGEYSVTLNPRVWVPNSFPTEVDAEGSLWDASNAAYRGHVEQCAAESNPHPDDARVAFALVESPDAKLGVPPKTSSDFVMKYNPGNPKFHAAGIHTPVRNDASGLLPRDLQGAPGWSAIRGTPASHETLTRAYLQTNGARYYTFYASLPDTSLGLTRPSPIAPTYGSEACGTSSGLNNGWDCDANNWWAIEGMPQDEDFELGVRVGDTYHLRDVDCYTGPLSAASDAGPCV